MYNSGNSGPRKGFGQSNTHKCAKCGHEMRFDKMPFMVECSRCGEVLFEKDLIVIVNETDK